MAKLLQAAEPVDESADELGREEVRVEQVRDRRTSKKKTTSNHKSDGRRESVYLTTPDHIRLWELDSFDEVLSWDDTDRAAALNVVKQMVQEYKDLDEAYDELQAHSDLQDTERTEEKLEFAELKSNLARKVGIIEYLEGQRQWLPLAEKERAEREERVRSREATAQSLDAEGTGATTEEGTTGTTKKKRSAKLPDPPQLTDGIEPDYEDWVMKMEYKLDANGDHWPTDQLKIGYIQNRLAGKAARQIYPRLRRDSKLRIESPGELFEAIHGIFGDDNKTQTAHSEFRALTQGRSRFADFWAEFQRITLDLLMDEQTLIAELRSKVNRTMKQALVNDVAPTTLRALAKRCVRYEINQAELFEPDSRRPYTAPAPRVARAPPTTTSTSYTPDTRTKPAYEDRPRLYRPPHRDPAKELLMRAGKCFECSKEGHLARDCPDKKGRASVHEVTAHDEKVDEQAKNA